jgi:hypothetical protein
VLSPTNKIKKAKRMNYIFLGGKKVTKKVSVCSTNSLKREWIGGDGKERNEESGTKSMHLRGKKDRFFILVNKKNKNGKIISKISPYSLDRV